MSIRYVYLKIFISKTTAPDMSIFIIKLEDIMKILNCPKSGPPDQNWDPRRGSKVNIEIC